VLFLDSFGTLGAFSAMLKSGGSNDKGSSSFITVIFGLIVVISSKVVFCGFIRRRITADVGGKLLFIGLLCNTIMSALDEFDFFNDPSLWLIILLLSSVNSCAENVGEIVVVFGVVVVVAIVVDLGVVDEIVFVVSVVLTIFHFPSSVEVIGSHRFTSSLLVLLLKLAGLRMSFLRGKIFSSSAVPPPSINGLLCNGRLRLFIGRLRTYPSA